MAALTASVAGYSVVFTLLLAGIGHLARPGVLRAALVTHGVLPAPAAVAAVVPVVEVALGAAGAAGLVSGGRLLTAGLAGAAALLAGYAGYSWRVLASGVGGPCGCSRRELPMSGWVVARAAALAALAGLGLAFAGSALPLRSAGSHLVIALLAAAAFGLLLWQLPAAMYDPARPAVPAPAVPAPAGAAQPALTHQEVPA
ncbi:MAG: hypothetical protein V7637_4858 [Mycobacteriales bacterium]